MAAAVIPQPGIHGNTAAFFPSVAFSSSTTVFSSPPPATSMRTVTPAGPFAVNQAATPSNNKKAAPKRTRIFNNKTRQSSKNAYSSDTSIAKAVNTLKKAVLGSLNGIASPDVTGNPRFVQVYSAMNQSMQDDELITASSTTGKENFECISPSILIANLIENMALLGKETYRSKHHRHLISQLLQLLLPNTRTTKIHIKKYLKALPFAGYQTLKNAIKKKEEFDRLVALAGKILFFNQRSTNKYGALALIYCNFIFILFCTPSDSAITTC